MSEAALLHVENLGRSFSGFRALDDLNATFGHERVTAVIGPNGAGKSTLFNILSGALKPSTGRVRFGERLISNLPQHEFAHLGIARTYQITNTFPQLSAHENVRVAAQALRSRYDFWTPRARFKELSDKAEAARAAVGLASRSNRPAAALAHGEQRALEIAIAIVADPKFLLLDEPTAGMGPEETKDMMTLVARLSETRRILLVEHKMKMILGLSERILVLHHGQLIADGTPAEIQADATVRNVYLGQSGGYA